MKAIIALIGFCMTINTSVIKAQTEEVKDAIDVIVLFCVAGGEKFDIKSSAELEGGLSIKKLGAKGEANITISKSEAKGLVEGLRQEMDKVSADQASEARACMQPYIDRIINIILGETSPDGSSGGSKDEQVAHENPYASIAIKFPLRNARGVLCFTDADIFLNGRLVPWKRGLYKTRVPRISAGSVNWVIQGHVLCNNSMSCESEGEVNSGTLTLLPGKNYLMADWSMQGNSIRNVCRFWLSEIDEERYYMKEE